MTTLEEPVLEHKREAEWLFAAGVFGSAESAVKRFGWLEPERLHDIGVQKFWSGVRGGANETKAAIDAGIYNQLVDRITEGYLLTSRLDDFVAIITDDDFLLTVAQNAKKLAQKITERDIEAVRGISQAIAEAAPVRQSDYPKASDAHLDFISAVYDDGLSRSLVKTHISNVDYALGGLEKGTLTLLGARPSVGKTALALQIAVDNAIKGKQKVVYFSLEMSKRQLWSRLACGRAMISWRDVLAGRITPEQRSKLKTISTELVEEIGDRLIIVDDPVITSASIWQAASDTHPDLLVVDHTALVTNKNDNEHLRLGEISWAGKQTAKQFDCATLYLVQLNRQLTKRENKRPTMTDLEGSGKLEQNADNIVFLHRPEYFDQDNNDGDISSAEIWIDKFRMSGRGIKINTTYDLRKQRFFGIAKMDYRG